MMDIWIILAVLSVYLPFYLATPSHEDNMQVICPVQQCFSHTATLWVISKGPLIESTVYVGKKTTKFGQKYDILLA